MRPAAKLGEYKGLEVGRAEAEVPDDAVQAELDRLREGFASLDPVDRPAAKGDLVVIDFSGTVDGEPFEGSEATDLMVELGAESLLPEFDRALAGAAAGDELTVEVGFPDDHRPESLAGKQASFAVTVKEVREKQLPDLDDEFAAEASEFETLERASRRDSGANRRGARGPDEAGFREAAVDAAADAARIELPKELVHARAHEMWERLERSLAARGASARGLPADAGQDARGAGHRLGARRRASAAPRGHPGGGRRGRGNRGHRRGDGGGAAAGGGRETPEQLLERLRANGRDALLREELRLRKAAELIAGSAKPIPQEQAVAREKLWTPEKDKAEGGEGGPLDPRGRSLTRGAAFIDWLAL